MHVRQDPVADQINANVYPKSNFFSQDHASAVLGQVSVMTYRIKFFLPSCPC